jgi:mono/diheme cytochrome c family protein
MPPAVFHHPQDDDTVIRMRAMLFALIALVAQSALGQGDELPRRLRETGLYAGVDGDALHADVLPFSPQYPLWSDGADKARWIRLPAGTAIDATNPDAWVFPVGTKLWKSFSHGGRPVETRLIERVADGSWRYATYVWKADGSDAELAPARGMAALPVATAPGGRYTVPGRGDCIACHADATVPVLGFTALQLSPARDANAVRGRPRSAAEVDLPALVGRGLLRGLPAKLMAEPPRIAAASASERAALGYLHANCANCHHANAGRVPLRLNLMQRVADPEASATEVLRSMVEAPSRYQPAAQPDARVVVPGDAAASVLMQRLRSRDARMQMPPLGTEISDPEGLALLAHWINRDLAQRKEP